ncbi:MAG: tyrosine-type recombinase/integrase [Planctomycetota bacterium]
MTTEDPPEEVKLSPTCVESLVEAWLAQIAEDKKPSTLEHYTKRIKPFRTAFRTKEFAELLPIEVLAYMREVNRFQPPHKKSGQLKSNATRASNAIVLELLQAFAIMVRVMPGPILPKLEKPIGRRREILPTDDEVKRVVKEACPEFGLIYKALDRAGARPSEFCGAKIADWNRENKEIVLKDHKTSESTGEVRRIAVGKILERMLLQAIGERTSGHIFLNSVGTPWTIDSLDRHFARVRDKLGINKAVVVYCNRHRVGTKLCEKGKIEDAADALNHKRLETTRLYVHKDRARLADTQDQMSTDEDDENEDAAPVAA